jgi:hypothetical protein
MFGISFQIIQREDMDYGWGYNLKKIIYRLKIVKAD